ncbi:MAG: Yip1 family protein [Betaproteobacteria bacterium]
MDTLRRMVAIVRHPSVEWDRLAGEDLSVDVLIGHFLLPLALLAPISTFIGIRTFNAQWDEDMGYLVPAQDAFPAAVTTLFATMGSVFALAGIFVLLAPLYGSSRDFRVALKVATFGAVPMLLAGATLFIPVMALFGLIGMFQSLYLWWMGARKVLQVRPSQQAEFIGIAMLLLIAISTLAGAAISSMGIV